jgi:hypothetical protein
MVVKMKGRTFFLSEWSEPGEELMAVSAQASGLPVTLRSMGGLVGLLLAAPSR